MPSNNQLRETEEVFSQPPLKKREAENDTGFCTTSQPLLLEAFFAHLLVMNSVDEKRAFHALHTLQRASTGSNVNTSLSTTWSGKSLNFSRSPILINRTQIDSKEEKMDNEDREPFNRFQKDQRAITKTENPLTDFKKEQRGLNEWSQHSFEWMIPA